MTTTTSPATGVPRGDEALRAAIDDARRSAIAHCAFVAVVTVAAAYMVLTWDTEGGIAEALRSGPRLDADVAIGILAYGALHGAGLLRDARRETRALTLSRTAVPTGGRIDG